jgi:hypothetical protein
MRSGTTERTSYTVDAEDVIIAVDEGFRCFAAENGASELADAVIGRRLWDFVDGHETCELLRVLFSRARLLGALTVPYRCDAPAIRRSMVLDVELAADGSLELRSTLVAAEDREPVEFMSRQASDGSPLLRVCSWCNRLEARGRWVEPELGITWLRPFEVETPEISHGVCPSCAQDVMREAEVDPRGQPA